MSIVETRAELPKNKTERRTNKLQTENQRIASDENFAIFLLRGMKANLANERAQKNISRTASKRIMETIEWEIDRIKDVQELRKKGK
jgi:hypothetical protein